MTPEKASFIHVAAQPGAASLKERPLSLRLRYNTVQIRFETSRAGRQPNKVSDS